MKKSKNLNKETIFQLLDLGVPKVRIAKKLNISYVTLYRFLKTVNKTEIEKAHHQSSESMKVSGSPNTKKTSKINKPKNTQESNRKKIDPKAININEIDDEFLQNFLEKKNNCF